MANTVRIAEMMEANGFKNVRFPSEYMGNRFEVVGEAKIGLQKMTTLVRAVDCLDQKAAEGVTREYLSMHNKKSSMLFGTFFLYCLVADKVEAEPMTAMLDKIAAETNKLSDNFRAGGGHLVVADMASNRIIAKRTSEGFVRYERKMVEIITQTMNKVE